MTINDVKRIYSGRDLRVVTDINEKRDDLTFNKDLIDGKYDVGSVKFCSILKSVLDYDEKEDYDYKYRILSDSLFDAKGYYFKSLLNESGIGRNYKKAFNEKLTKKTSLYSIQNAFLNITRHFSLDKKISKTEKEYSMIYAMRAIYSYLEEYNFSKSLSSDSDIKKLIEMTSQLIETKKYCDRSPITLKSMLRNSRSRD